jgi:porin
MHRERRIRSSVVALGLLVSGAALGQSPLPPHPDAEYTSLAVTSDATEFDLQPSSACDSWGESPLSACDGYATEYGLCDSLWTREKLTGDWLGHRSRMIDSGYTLDVSTTQYYQGVTRGGIDQRFEYGGRNDYYLNVDGEKAGLWKGSFIALRGETRYAESINPYVGSLLPANMAMDFPDRSDVTALTGVKFMQFLSEDKMVFAGKINTFDDVRQPLTGAGLNDGFMNGALMFNPIVVRTVPYSTWGAGFVKLHDMEPVFSLVVFDTNNTPTTSGFDTFFDNGATILSSVNLPTDFIGLAGHQGITATYSTGDYTNLSPNAYFQPGVGIVIESAPKDGSWSLAYNFDQALAVSSTDPRKRWGVFGNLGIADDNPSPIRWFGSVGLAGASPIAGRSADTFGVGYFYTGVSGALKDLAPVLLPLGDDEGVELYYNVAMTPWCHVTPDLQVIDPFRQRIDSSLLFGLRAKIDF